MTSEQQNPRPSANGQGQQNGSSSASDSTGPGTSHLVSAIGFAKRGWPALPLHSVIDDRCSCGRPDCGSSGKHPRTEHGVKDATTDLPQIVEWWQKWPKANIGIATGRVSGLVVIDIDPRNGGDDNFDALVDEHGPLPDTVESITGGGGRHLLFAYPEARIRLPGKLADGVDVKSDGGYIVAPGSDHASGGSYEWEASSDPDDTPLAPLPHWIAALGSPKTEHNGTGTGNRSERLDTVTILAGVPVGERNDVVYRYACRLRGKNLTWGESMVLLGEVVANSPQDPPFTMGEARECLESAWKHPPGEAERIGSAEDRTDRFAIIHGDDIENLPEPEWLIEGVMERGSLAVLYGDTGSFKSFVALSMAGWVSTGCDWQGRKVHEGTALYVAAEGVGDLGLRVAAFRAAHRIDSLPGVSYILEPVNLYTRDRGVGDVDLLATRIAELNPVLIIFDTLARSMAGGDESFAKDINSVIASADRLRHATGATVLIIHHSGHDKNRERGSSALKAASDTFIKQTTKGLQATLTCDKMKTAAEFDPITVRLAEFGESLAVVSEGVDTTLTTDEGACARLVSPKPLTHGEWKTVFVEAGLGSESTFERRRKDLVGKGIVKPFENLRGGTRYRVTEPGEEALGVTGGKEVSPRK